MEEIQMIDENENGNDAQQAVRYCLLGDGIFRHVANGNNVLISYHVPAPRLELAQWQIDENALFKSIREHIEHSYGAIEGTFALCAQTRFFKLKSSQFVAIESLILSFFFFNCYTAENGNSTTNQFNCIQPTLNEYLNINNN